MPARFAWSAWSYARASGSAMSTTSLPPGTWTCAWSRSPAPGWGGPIRGVRAGGAPGPPEEWDGPWAYLERTRPYLALEAITRAAEITGRLLLASIGVDREELTVLLLLLGLEHFDRQACNRAPAGLAETERRAAT